MSRFSSRMLLGLGVLLPSIMCSSLEAQAQSEIAEFGLAYPNVTFDFPLGIRFPDDGTNKVYIAEFGGRVKVMDNTPDVQKATVFLDLSDRIGGTSPMGEFFALEFHPDYAENGYFFVRYKLENPTRSILARFSRSASDPFLADPASEVILLDIPTPDNANNHHGGDIAFGLDGYLYVPVGDGGTQFDIAGNAQDRSTLLGKVLRLDVDSPSNGLEYGIPAGNPFVGNTEGWREEVFASGVRNPWRMTIDRATGDVWLGDVGEADWEEVDLIRSGANYGWPVMEGPVCAPFIPTACDPSPFTLPVWAYTHELGNSITGGYVYRGFKIPVLRGQYVFADYGSGSVWHIERDNPPSAELLLPQQFAVTTFGEDLDGELYFTRFFEGTIYKITAGPGATSTTGDPGNPGPFRLSAYPQPTVGPVNFHFESEAGRLRLSVYDVLGRAVAIPFDEEVGPGAQRTVTMDMSGWAAGIYIARLEGRGEVETVRFVLAR